jgi:uncharacterized protein
MDLNHPRDAQQVWTMEKITVLILCAQSICTVDHTLNVKDDFFYFLYQKLLACIGSRHGYLTKSYWVWLSRQTQGY